MIVKMLVLEVYIAHSNSLKDKRSVIKSLIKRCRQKFNVSISEIADLESHRHSRIAIVTVSNDNTYADKVLDKCLNFIETEYDLDIVNIERERL